MQLAGCSQEFYIVPDGSVRLHQGRTGGLALPHQLLFTAFTLFFYPPCHCGSDVHQNRREGLRQHRVLRPLLGTPELAGPGQEPRISLPNPNPNKLQVITMLLAQGPCPLLFKGTKEPRHHSKLLFSMKTSCSYFFRSWSWFHQGEFLLQVLPAVLF